MRMVPAGVEAGPKRTALLAHFAKFSLDILAESV